MRDTSTPVDQLGEVSVLPDRPSTVPADYAVTPFGYFDPSCVYEVGPTQIVVPDDEGAALVDVSANVAARTQLIAASAVSGRASPDTAGSTTSALDSITAKQIAASPRVNPCAHDHYDFTGKVTAEQTAAVDSSAEEPKVAPTISGWIESANTSSLGAMSYMHAEWNVPTAPAATVSQTVYFFPGFENLSGGTIIMQPVLGWHDTNFPSIPGWSAASWNCCSVGNVYHSDAFAVTGSTVSGDVSSNGCSTATGVCSTWAITTYDWGSQRSTTFNTTSGGRAMNWVFGGALEVWNLSACNQLPGGSVTFKNFYFEDVGDYIKTPSWSISPPSSSLSPACGYSASVGSGNSVVLNY
ncbi:MAG: hypothetical protein FWF43_09455 [Propionibacteriaceae bacterium]|nr:hypothetical protein [Propionibacteriaceae bacterium]